MKVNVQHRRSTTCARHSLHLALVLATSAAWLATAAPEVPWSYPPAPPLRLRLIRGLWHESYRLEETLAAAGGGIYEDSWVQDGTGSGWPGPGNQGGGGLTPGFDRMGLMRCHIVVVAHANASCFGKRQELLVDYVRNGGAVMFLGGRFAFGRQYRESAFAALCPVEFPGQGRWASDLVHVPDGLELQPGADSFGDDSDLVSWADKPLVYWYHEVLPKPDAKVLVTAGGRPLLVAWQYGSGRVLVFAGTVMGEPAAGQVPFWQWSGWPPLLGNGLRWLAAAPAGAAHGELPAALRQALAPADALDELDAGPSKTNPQQQALLERLAETCHQPAAISSLLDVAGGLTGDISPRTALALGAAADGLSELASLARPLLASGEPGKTALGLRLLGASRATDAVTTLAHFYQTGAPAVAQTATISADGLPNMKVQLPKDQQQAAFTIRLAALLGLGRVGNAEALTSLAPLLTQLRGPGTPAPQSFSDLLSDDQRLYQAALLAALRCGHSAAAEPLADLLMDDLYTICRARTEANKPKDRLAQVHETLPLQLAWQETVCSELNRLPDSVLPALATCFAAETDRRVAVFALATFAGRVISPAAAAALAGSGVPAVAALAHRR